jgi:23S rRNA pseudouridine2457 synthase
MTATVGFPTLRLVRVRIGNVHLGNLKAGEVRGAKFFLPLLGLILYFF